MKNTVQRIKEFIDFKGISVRSFEKSTNFSNGAFASQFKNNRNIGSDKIENILHSFPEINPTWLLTGNGEMIKSEKEQVHYNNNGKENKGTPLIPLDAMAGFGTGSMQIMEYDTKHYIVPEFDELKVDFMIRVKGSSMYPKYNSGDIVACRKLPLDTFFQWNKVYVLDTSQGAMIKRIHQSEKEGFLLLVSDNEKYKPFNIPIEDIYSLSIVIGVIRLE